MHYPSWLQVSAPESNIPRANLLSSLDIHRMRHGIVKLIVNGIPGGKQLGWRRSPNTLAKSGRLPA